jgi:hypothetical protein
VQQGGRFADTGRHHDHVAVAHVVEGIEGTAASGAVHLLHRLHGRLLSSFLFEKHALWQLSSVAQETDAHLTRV